MMLSKFIKRAGLILAGLLIVVVSCVKDNNPPDCTPPANPTVKVSIDTKHLRTKSDSLNPDSVIFLSASGVSAAKFFWSGPNGFASEIANPVIKPVSISNSGTYWVKALVGYCFSDSVPVPVNVINDTTCSLGDNGADFPNGSFGPFTMTTRCATGSNGSYSLLAYNMDSSIVVNISFKQTPTKQGIYILTNSTNPSDNQVFCQLTGLPGGNYYNTTSNAYVKVRNGKINVIVCQALFNNIGVFSANLTCK
jgi:hypothetical protein